jgi:hypothetical protein
MTQAKSVHSTPASKIVEFPKTKRPLPADRPSALACVKKSGLRLVDADDMPMGESPTHEQCAAMEFEPWPGKSEDIDVLSGDNWMEHRVAVIFAHASMFMSKRRLMEVHRDAADEIDQLMASILETAEWLKGIAAMMEAAQARLIVAGCAAVDEGMIADGALHLHLRSAPRSVVPLIA